VVVRFCAVDVHLTQSPGVGSAEFANWGEDVEAMGQAISIVLVHAAWADGSSWSKVITALLSRGHQVISAPIPLTSLTDDRNALEHALQRVSGPVVLGGHAYSGAVISAVVSDQVKGLVFVSGLTPDEGETVLQVFTREQSHPKAPHLAPDPWGQMWLPPAAFPEAFAQHGSQEQTALLAATQRPISVECISEKAPRPAWKDKPSWYLIAEEDRMINPKTQQFLAARMDAHIRSEKVDHTPMVTAPAPVIDIFLQAAAATAVMRSG
jgi:pimeloyl-ACP methyl ester carboxylesterase